MNPLCVRLHTMREALESSDLFADLLPGPTWALWRVVLIASQGEALITDEERAIFLDLTGREHCPGEPADELWIIVGRRGGKTRALAVLAAYLSGCVDYSAIQAPGERLKLPILAQTTRTATKAFSYILGLFEGSPELRTLLVNKARPGEEPRYDVTMDTIRLCTDLDIEVVPANFKTVRGETLVAAICDEVAWWQVVDGSANPDVEILDAVRNGMGTTGGQLCVLSSPYARKGQLYETHKRHHGPGGDPSILVVQAPSLKMNPSLSPSVVAKAYERDPAKASAEYGAEFRKDVETFISLDAIQACIEGASTERGPVSSLRYFGFTDPSGGGADAMTLAIAHKEGDRTILDAVREEYPGANPDAVVERFAETLKAYGLRDVTGDRYAGEWPRERFRVHGITYAVSEKSKSEIYGAFLPILNSGRCALLPVPKLEQQLASLERRTSRGTGRDIIDHPQTKSAHDDVANAACGAIVGAQTTRISIMDLL